MDLDIERMLPKEYNTKAAVSTIALIWTLERAMFITEPNMLWMLGRQ
jgi:hypothetical protein